MNETEMKIYKSAKNACTLLTIAEILVIATIVAIIAIVGVYSLIFALEGEAGLIQTIGNDEVIADFTSLIPNGETYSIGELMGVLITFVMSAGTYLSLFLAVLIVAKNFFKETRNSLTPFVLQNAKRIKVIAGLLLAASLIPILIEQIGSFILKIPLDVAVISLEGVILAVILVCIGTLFEYGCELQKESDETI